MKVVLLKDLKGKGKKGDIIEVNSGYALNYLIPNGVAKAGTNTNINEANQAKQASAYHAEQERLKAVALCEQVNGTEVTIKVKCGAMGKIFGSVTNKEVGAELDKLGFNIDKKKIDLDQIKSTGTYDCKIKLHVGVVANIKVNVVSE